MNIAFFFVFFLHQYWYWVLNVPLGTERTLQTEVPFMLLILDDWEPILKYVKNELISILTYDRVTVFFTLRKKELISILTHVRKTANLKCARWRKKMVGFLFGYIYRICYQNKMVGFFVQVYILDLRLTPLPKKVSERLFLRRVRPQFSLVLPIVLLNGPTSANY